MARLAWISDTNSPYAFEIWKNGNLFYTSAASTNLASNGPWFRGSVPLVGSFVAGDRIAIRLTAGSGYRIRIGMFMSGAPGLLYQFGGSPIGTGQSLKSWSDDTRVSSGGSFADTQTTCPRPGTVKSSAYRGLIGSGPLHIYKNGAFSEDMGSFAATQAKSGHNTSFAAGDAIGVHVVNDDQNMNIHLLAV